MSNNRDKRKGSSAPSLAHTSITLREENSGRKQNKAKGEKGGSTNMKSILKLQHLKSLATWASQEASIPSLGAFFGHRLMACGDPDPSLFPCQRCETILQPGNNCTVRIESNRTKARRRSKKSNASQNNVIFWCHFCSHRNMKRGTPKGHMKEICPKVKPSLVSKHTNPIPQTDAKPEIIPQNEVEACKEDEIASTATAVGNGKVEACKADEIASSATIVGNGKVEACRADEIASSATTKVEACKADEIALSTTAVSILIADSPATPALATDSPITNSPETPLARTGNTLLGGKRRKRNKSGGYAKEAEAETQKSVSASNKRRRKSWTTLREIAESSKQGNTRNVENIAIPFFL